MKTIVFLTTLVCCYVFIHYVYDAMALVVWIVGSHYIVKIAKEVIIQ